jgi:soluble lytic murein transglycosylase-like protein
VYRGSRIPNLRGTYLFADYCEGDIQGLTRASDGSITVTSLGMQLPGVSSFGEDVDGELYAMSTGGAIGRIDGTTFDPNSTSSTPPASGPEPASSSGNARGAEPMPGDLLSDDPPTAATQLVAAERALRDPTTTPQVVSDNASIQQLAYRYLGTHPEWDATVLEQVPVELRDAVSANLNARRELAAIPGSVVHDELPAWRIQAPLPADDLLGAYRKAEQEFGVGWNYLAAINLVESDLGRIHGLSTAGAQGPMQFMPATWDAFGGGGDVNAAPDAIAGAARYLAHNGFAEGNVDGALYRYNNSQHYVNAIKSIASVLAADPRSFNGYYGWDVFYATTAGVVRLPIGYEQSEPVNAADYLAVHPEAGLSGIANSH